MPCNRRLNIPSVTSLWEWWHINSVPTKIIGNVCTINPHFESVVGRGITKDLKSSIIIQNTRRIIYVIWINCWVIDHQSKALKSSLLNLRAYHISRWISRANLYCQVIDVADHFWKGLCGNESPIRVLLLNIPSRPFFYHTWKVLKSWVLYIASPSIELFSFGISFIIGRYSC